MKFVNWYYEIDRYTLRGALNDAEVNLIELMIRSGEI